MKMTKCFSKFIFASAFLVFWVIGINNAYAQLAPKITTQPVSTTVVAPATATFTIVATGTPTPTYQWQQELPGTTTYTTISGATKASYTTPATALANSGTKFECVVSNTAGTVTSSAATLTVHVKPTITTQPVNTTVTAPATATFTIVATGTPTPTYQWQQELPSTTTYTTISGATKASYTTPATALANSGTKFECVVSNTAGTVTSSAATLTVHVKPSITTQPTSVTVTAPAKATFKVVATGTPTPTYQWQQELPGTTTYTTISGATKASYTTPATALANSGTKFECVVSNTAGTVTSSAATLTVHVKPTITTQPTSVTVTAPATATFTIVATGTPTPTYQWQQELPGTTTYTTISGATSASYTTAATASANNQTKYECVVSNAAGSVTSNAVTLTVNVLPTITTQPVNVTVTAPATATFTVVASGIPAPTYKWMQELYGTSTYTTIAGATGSTYTTPATSAIYNLANYKCVVTNSVGSVTSNVATLTVNIAPYFFSQPVNTSIPEPNKAYFSATGEGSPLPTYQWMEKPPGTNTYTTISGATSSLYITPATTLADNGTQYECVISNVAGSVTSNPATLTVYIEPPIITTQPNNEPVTAPATATFTVVASSTPAPTYQWLQEAPGATTYTNIPGATSASYTTAATTVAMSGTQYECVVTNPAGSVTSSSATLLVYPTPVAPTIITQPVNVTVTEPALATFTVEAIGTPAPNFQWMQESPGSSTFTAISGAIYDWYSISPTSIADSGTLYECVVSNVAGSVTSNSAVLVVNSSPVVSIISPANNSTFLPGSNMTIIANVSENNIQEVSFYNGTTLLGTTSAPYTYTMTNLLAGTYTLTAKATDDNGITTISSPVVVNVASLPEVTIVSPVNQTTIETGYISITAITEGSISNVAFYNGATLLGKITSASNSYTFSWTNVPAGTYSFTAVATGTDGTTATSSPITVTINSANFTTAVDDNIVTKTDANGNTTSYQYDKLNRLLKTTFADGSTISYTYDLFGNQINVTDQRGNTLTKTYDAYERLSQTKDPLGGITQFNYDTNGDLLTMTDANNHQTTYTYDTNYRVLTKTNALNDATTFTYDPVGNVLTRQDANGKTTNYTYDALNRLKNAAYPDGTSVANVYDALGRKTSMTDATGQTTYTYDALRLLTKTTPGTSSTITYTYDGEGNRLMSVDQNNRPINNTYDALNRLSTVLDQNGTTTYNYDANSNLISKIVPNGVTETYSYDGLNRVLTAVNKNGSGVVSSYTNSYDQEGMITKKVFADGSTDNYTYDALNQMLSETNQTSSGVNYSNVFTYDPVGNRLSWVNNITLGYFWNVDSTNMPPAVLTNMTSLGYGKTANPNQAMSLTRAYSRDAGNRLNNWSYTAYINNLNFPIQTDTYTYDNNGNRLSKQAVLTGQEGTPQQTSYTYDFENRLNQLTYINIPNISGTQTDAITYNGEGLRVGMSLNNTVSNYLYDGSNVLLERDNSGNTTKTYTRGLDEGGGIGSLISQDFTSNNAAVTQYYNYNDLGSVANLTSSTGAAASSYNYDAFGNLLTAPASSDTNRYLFSTKEFDSRSGLYYFGARYYDPEIGRWLTPDPLGFINGSNMYLYCGNNPINLVDPLGLFDGYLFTKSLAGLAGSALQAGVGAAIAGTGAGAVPGSILAVYGAYGIGANVGNIVNSFTNTPAGPTGPVQAVSESLGASTTVQTAATAVDLGVPLLAGGPNPNEVSEIGSLLLTTENTSLQTTEALQYAFSATQVADAGFTLDESGNTLYTSLSPYLGNNGSSYSNNLGGKEHAFY